VWRKDRPVDPKEGKNEVCRGGLKVLVLRARHKKEKGPRPVSQKKKGFGPVRGERKKKKSGRLQKTPLV